MIRSQPLGRDKMIIGRRGGTRQRSQWQNDPLTTRDTGIVSVTGVGRRNVDASCASRRTDGGERETARWEKIIVDRRRRTRRAHLRTSHKAKEEQKGQRSEMGPHVVVNNTGGFVEKGGGESRGGGGGGGRRVGGGSTR